MIYYKNVVKMLWI